MIKYIFAFVIVSIVLFIVMTLIKNKGVLFLFGCIVELVLCVSILQGSIVNRLYTKGFYFYELKNQNAQYQEFAKAKIFAKAKYFDRIEFEKDVNDVSFNEFIKILTHKDSYFIEHCKYVKNTGRVKSKNFTVDKDTVTYNYKSFNGETESSFVRDKDVFYRIPKEDLVLDKNKQYMIEYSISDTDTYKAMTGTYKVYTKCRLLSR